MPTASSTSATAKWNATRKCNRRASPLPFLLQPVFECQGVDCGLVPREHRSELEPVLAVLLLPRKLLEFADDGRAALVQLGDALVRFELPRRLFRAGLLRRALRGWQRSPHLGDGGRHLARVLGIQLDGLAVVHERPVL